VSNTAITKRIDHSKTSETSLSLIIHGGNNQICVDSRDIAKEFDGSIRAYLEQLMI